MLLPGRCRKHNVRVSCHHPHWDDSNESEQPGADYDTYCSMPKFVQTLE